MTRGIEYVYLETHNWGKTVSFWQKLGFRLDLDLGRSGRLVHPDGGAAIFVEEVPPTRPLENQLYLRAARPDVHPEAPAELAKDWHSSHWGTRLLELRDPDGRAVILQHSDAEA
jgi:hypothetical protein